MSEENNTFENNNQSVEETPSGDNYSYQNKPSGSEYNSGKGQNTGLGIASMVCGIVAIPIMCCTNVGSILSIILGIVAVVLGIVQIVKNEQKGMAIAGIVCGAVAVVVCIALVVLGTYMISTGLYDEIMRQYGSMY